MLIPRSSLPTASRSAVHPCPSSQPTTPIETQKAYEKWLEILDKGIGETLEEAGVFDASFTTDDDDVYDDGYGDGYGNDRDRRRRRPRSSGGGADTNNLYDSYTNYGGYGGDVGEAAGGERGGGSGRYDPEGTRDERGLDYDDRCVFLVFRGREDCEVEMEKKVCD